MILLFLSVVLLCSGSVLVELSVFSGTRNPTWEINENMYQNILTLLSEKSSYLPSQRMGYSGFIVKRDDEIFTVHHSLKAEMLMLNTMPESVESYQSIFSHCQERILETDRESSSTFTPNLSDDTRVGVYITYGDNVSNFLPHRWNYYPVQDENNCYNYGQYTRTDTFAQPGRGSGHKWEENTCDSVGAAAVRDGLVKYTGDPPLGDKTPDDGHYVGLLIWPNTNFHWVRKDYCTYWSHKPGSTEARNVDNNGKKIYDPSKADFAPWTQFCGYFVSVPSKEKLN